MGENKEACYIIINPHAGNGKGGKDWPLIESCLIKKNISYEFIFTGKKQHAIELSSVAADNGYKKIIAVGGDGTLNEVANGILKSKKPSDVIIGIIPVGSGNDWCRMFGIPAVYDDAIKTIINKKVFIQDVGIVKCSNGNEIISRFFVNAAGLGFDAKVVQKTNDQKDRGRSGKLLYLLNLFTSLFSYKVVEAEISIDDKKIKTKLFSMNVGICKYSGGGMMQVPNAVADDGLFDVTVINKIGKFDVIRNVKNLYDGSFIKHRKVDIYRGVKITVNAIPPVSVEVDGETLGHSPLEFSIIPHALKIISV
ncbi:MAG: diacylglycerol kinase family protein [Bacteroidota bacterium]